ncbi:MAG: 50S ribosomal protein L18e [Candidatus Woesearchaeota archaeon]
MKRTGPTNPRLNFLISELKKVGSIKKINLFKRLAFDLEKSTRNRRIVNLSRINRHTSDNETIVIPGKVLGDGSLDHKLTIYAFDYSNGAVSSIENASSKALKIEELLNSEIKGKKIRIIG